MKKLFILLGAVSFLLINNIFAQNEFDALRFSRYYLYGTARTMGMANAFSALGAELGAVADNPAALGLMKHSDFSISPGFDMTTSEASFNGTNRTDIKYSFALNNLGIALAFKLPNPTFKYFNIGLVYSKILDFNQRTWIQGNNPKGSMLEDMVRQANGIEPKNLDPFYTYLAYQVWLLDVADPNQYIYTNPIHLNNTVYYGENQNLSAEESGSGHSTDLVAAVNIKDIAFVGLTLSSISMHYSKISKYTESGYPSPVDLKSFDFNEYQKDNVSGYAVKLGLTLAPIKFIRIALAAQSPYFLKIDDNYHSSMDSYWYTPDTAGHVYYVYQSPVNDYKFKINTPWRLTTGIAFIYKDLFALDFDYEYNNYKLIRFQPNPDYTFETENENIAQYFRATNTYRVGAEINLNGLQLRTGYAYYGSAFSRFSPVTVLAGGIGFHMAKTYFDFAVNYRKSSTVYWLYQPYSDEPVPNVKYGKFLINITVGTKF